MVVSLVFSFGDGELFRGEVLVSVASSYFRIG